MTMLGEHLQALRRAADLSLQDVADRAGLTKSHLWDLEQGRSANPTVETIVRIAVAFGAEAKELLVFAASDCAKRLKVRRVSHSVVERG